MTATSIDASADDHTDLPARIDAATAMRRLSHAIVSHRAEISDLHRIAAAAEELAARIETQPARSRLDEMMTNPRFEAALESGSLDRAVDDGAFVDLFHDSPVSGSANPLGMGLRISRDGDEAVGTINLGPGWEGAPGRGHGGIVAACVDETIGGLLPILGTMAFTGELTLKYRAPCPLATPLEFRASLQRRDGRKLYIECIGTSPEGLFVEATALFIAVDLDHLAGLIAQAPTSEDTEQ